MAGESREWFIRSKTFHCVRKYIKFDFQHFSTECELSIKQHACHILLKTIYKMSSRSPKLKYNNGPLVIYVINIIF